MQYEHAGPVFVLIDSGSLCCELQRPLDSIQGPFVKVIPVRVPSLYAQNWKHKNESLFEKSLRFYSTKLCPRKEIFYSGDPRSNIFSQLRVGNLALRWLSYHYDNFRYEKLCLLCKKEKESPEHFAFKCSELSFPPKHKSKIIVKLPDNYTDIDFMNTLRAFENFDS